MDYVALMFFSFSFLYIFFFFWYIELYFHRKGGYGILELWSEIFKQSKQFWKELALFFNLFLIGSLALILLIVKNLLMGILVVIYMYFPIMYIVYWGFIYPKSIKISSNGFQL